ncbi:glycosyl transferase [Geomonas silvestris]|uniref:Glycosyl transferase n=1 Tax=Geomonas silvestris TaxID=2740184 RepID=A0A6V8MI83_9BACT|nr:glycosyl transferase [Geomonas silvestris]
MLLQSRTTLFSVPGGDTVQMRQTAAALERAGCHATISTELEPDLTGYDLVHLFNLTRPQELYLQARNARRRGRALVLSPIYVSYRDYERCARGGVAGWLARRLGPGKVEYLKILARALRNSELNRGTAHLLLKGYGTLQRRVVELAGVLLPNSESEMARARLDLPYLRLKPYVVVPNAVDHELFGPPPVGAAPNGEDRRCVLSVARIDGLKGQLTLVRAMKGLPWPLVLIGKPAPNHLAYFEQVKREAGPNVRIIGELNHAGLPPYYRAAKVHVLASWMETTGLSSLEAGAQGCNLVITDRGDTREYFGDQAYYCEPGSVASLREAIIKAYEAPSDPLLSERILEHYTWDRAAQRTLEGYRLALDQGGLSC